LQVPERQTVCTTPAESDARRLSIVGLFQTASGEALLTLPTPVLP
jgi:hypothetical protein